MIPKIIAKYILKDELNKQCTLIVRHDSEGKIAYECFRGNMQRKGLMVTSKHPFPILLLDYDNVNDALDDLIKALSRYTILLEQRYIGSKWHTMHD